MEVIIYGLDHISRSILDFSNMIKLFQQYKVKFVSSAKKFDTSTSDGTGYTEYLYPVRPARTGNDTESG